MLVKLKESFFTIVGNGKVYDENNQLVYRVKGYLFSLTHKKKIFDKDGKLLYVIKGRLFNWLVRKAFVYDSNKTKIAAVQDKVISLKPTYLVTDNPDEIKIDGNCFSLKREIIRNEEKIGSININLKFGTNWDIEASEEDMPFVIALVVAMRVARNSKKNKVVS